MRKYPPQQVAILHLPLPGDAAGREAWDTSKQGTTERDRTLETVPVRATDDLIPIVAVVGVPTDRASVWFMRLDGDTTSGAPPKMEMEIRHGAGCATELAVHGVLAAPTWDSAGLIAQVSGRLVTQWELWGRVVPGTDPRVVKLSVRILVDRIGGGGGCCNDKGQLAAAGGAGGLGASAVGVDAGAYFTADAVG